MIAEAVWDALGDCDHYLEPFFGSGAVLLARPDYDPARHTETVCDKDGFIANVWRAIQFSPDETAKWCDWPVNHADLMARRAELIRNEERLLGNLIIDPLWHDPVMAGYWIWAASCWIGSGLTGGSKLASRGVHQIPHLTTEGNGVHSQRPHLGDKGEGIHQISQQSGIYEWFTALSERLRRVRVVCGDWSRICGGNWQDATWNTAGVFFDPPYSVSDRDTAVYHHDNQTSSQDVEKWALERGYGESYRIVVAGYEGEHDALTEADWTVKEWKTNGGYGNTTRNGNGSRGQENSHRERLWFSPHCCKLETQGVLNLAGLK